MGWGVLDYFVEQPGRYTFTEAFIANHHALVHRLTTYFPELAGAETDLNGRTATTPKIGARAKAAGLSLNDARGLLFDRDMVVFYGDPAWEARLADRPKAFEQSLRVEAGDVFIRDQTPTRHEQLPADQPERVAAGRTTVPGLPAAPGAGRQVVEGADLEPVVTDDFILVPEPAVCDPARSYRVKFTATPMP